MQEGPAACCKENSKSGYHTTKKLDFHAELEQSLGERVGILRLNNILSKLASAKNIQVFAEDNEKAPRVAKSHLLVPAVHGSKNKADFFRDVYIRLIRIQGATREARPMFDPHQE